MPEPYRILVTGSRDWADRTVIDDTLTAIAAANTFHNRVTVVVHGACPTGADAMADEWARWHAQRSPLVEFERHRANWRAHGPAAGPLRNREMVAAGADACLAFIGPCRKRHCTRPRPHGSHGASDCANWAEAAGIPTRRWTA